MKNLSEKVVVVSGAAGLLGQEFIKAVAKNGGIAIATDIDLIALEKFEKDLNTVYPGKVIGCYMDITDEKSIECLIAETIKKHGKIDGFVNNAYPRNKFYGLRLENVQYEGFCENLRWHLGGYFLTMQKFCSKFVEQGYGNVVNMASIYGTMAPRFGIYEGTSMTMPVEYAAIKSGVIQLTKYYAQYYKNTNIRVNSISPGGIKAGQDDKFVGAYSGYCNSKGMLDPADVADALIFILSDQSKYITGQNLIIDDGFSL